MALEPDDFLEPKGELTEEMFPGRTLAGSDGDVAGWLAEAQAKTDAEEAQKAWVYYRAFRALEKRLYVSAASVDLEDDGRLEWRAEQMQWAREQRTLYAREFERLTTSEVASSAPRSTTTRSRASWI